MLFSSPQLHIHTIPLEDVQGVYFRFRHQTDALCLLWALDPHLDYCTSCFKLLPCASLSTKGLLQDRDRVLLSSIDQDFSTIFDTKVFDQDRQSLRCPMSDGHAQEKREHPFWSRSKLHPGAQLHSPLQNWPVRGPLNSYNSLQDLKSQGPHSLTAPRALEKTQRSEESLELAGTQIENEALKRAEAGRGLLGGAPTTSPVRTLIWQSLRSLWKSARAPRPLWGGPCLSQERVFMSIWNYTLYKQNPKLPESWPSCTWFYLHNLHSKPHFQLGPPS